MTSFFAGTSGVKKSASYNIELRIRPFGGVFQLKHLSNLVEDGTSHWNNFFQAPEQIPAQADIEMRAQINTAAITDASISAGFDIILIES